MSKKASHPDFHALSRRIGRLLLSVFECRVGCIYSMDISNRNAPTQSLILTWVLEATGVNISPDHYFIILLFVQKIPLVRFIVI
jgi:hypothetical protein